MIGQSGYTELGFSKTANNKRMEQLVNNEMCPKCRGYALRGTRGEPDTCASCSRPLQWVPDGLDGLNGHYELIGHKPLPRNANGANLRKSVPKVPKGA